MQRRVQGNDDIRPHIIGPVSVTTETQLPEYRLHHRGFLQSNDSDSTVTNVYSIDSEWASLFNLWSTLLGAGAVT